MVPATGRWPIDDGMLAGVGCVQVFVSTAEGACVASFRDNWTLQTCITITEVLAREQSLCGVRFVEIGQLGLQGVALRVVCGGDGPCKNHEPELARACWERHPGICESVHCDEMPLALAGAQMLQKPLVQQEAHVVPSRFLVFEALGSGVRKSLALWMIGGTQISTAPASYFRRSEADWTELHFSELHEDSRAIMHAAGV